ncbi:MAG: hypothetical protein C0507_19735 [Cyanobacteria bacterium PR.3.49]|nr:hypothetical protein [Cyanobacteria bacterium PR.3.49]
MSYSDDYATTSTANDAQDPIADSPVTTERVVDTQSGFLVVIKKLEARLALSVKRRLGTPPSSSILLTQDESLKLARILSDNGAGEAEPPQPGRRKNFARDIDNWINTLSTKPASQEEQTQSAGELNAYNQLEQYESVDGEGLERSPASRWDKFMMDEPAPEARRAARKRKRPSISVPPGAIKVALGLAVTLVVVAIAGTVIANLKAPEKSEPKQDVLAAAPLSDTKVDKFARAFVSNMLDFNPATYRMSQVQAMAVMKPELLDNYWTETNFPLSKRQLAGLPQNQTVLITKVTQERVNETTKDVDIYAELVSADNKMSSPVHLKLKVAQALDNLLQVIEQKDLTAGTHE